MKLRKTILATSGLALFTAGTLTLAMGVKGGSKGDGRPTFQFEVPPYVMSCGYKVYKDPTVMNGRYWVTKTILKNDGEGSMHDVEVSCRIPGLTDWAYPTRYPEILAGQTITHCFYPDFEDSIVEKTTRDREVIDVRIRYREAAKAEVTEETRQLPFTLLGRNQLAYTDIPENEIVQTADYYSTTFFDACFVTPHDPIVRYLTQRIQQRMGGSMSNSGNPKEIEKFVRAMYDTLADCGVRYGGTSGLPIESGGVSTTVQEVRLPREVITGTAGLCIELSNLFASICAAEGLEPVLFFTSNHAWPSVRLPNGDYLAVESTMLGSGSYEEAKQEAWLNTVAFLNNGSASITDDAGKVHTRNVTPIQMLDVKAQHQAGIRPIELSESPDLRQRIDDLFDKVASNERAQQQQQQAQTQLVQRSTEAAQHYVAEQDPPAAVSGRSLQSSLGFSLRVPNHWMVQQQPIVEFPALELYTTNGTGLDVEVYGFAGYRTVRDAMASMSRTGANFGLSFSYQAVDIPDSNYGHLNGMTYTNGQPSSEWTGAFHKGSQGLSVVIFGAEPGYLEQHNAQIRALVDTIR